MKINKTKKMKPFKMLIFGDAKVGKSTLASQFPKAIFIDLEGGLNQIDTESFEQCFSVDQVLSQMDHLIVTDLPYKFVVIDSLTHLERMIHNDIAASAGKKDISELGFGKGYELAKKQFEIVLSKADELNNAGYSVVFLAHEIIEGVSPPDDEGFQRYQVDLNKKVCNIVYRAMDAVIRCCIKVRLKESSNGKKLVAKTNERELQWSARASAAIGNRYGVTENTEMDAKVILDKIRGFYGK